MRNLSNTTKLYVAFALAGLVVGIVLAFPLVRVATPTKVVTKTVTPSYKLQNGATGRTVYNTLGRPAQVQQASATNPFTCAEFVGHIQPGQQAPSDWYAIYCFRTR